MFPEAGSVTAAPSRPWEARTIPNLHPCIREGEGDINRGWCCGDDIMLIARIRVLVCADEYRTTFVSMIGGYMSSTAVAELRLMHHC